jgi:hypothetical protein
MTAFITKSVVTFMTNIKHPARKELKKSIESAKENDSIGNGSQRDDAQCKVCANTHKNQLSPLSREAMRHIGQKNLAHRRSMN